MSPLQTPTLPVAEPGWSPEQKAGGLDQAGRRRRSGEGEALKPQAGPSFLQEHLSLSQAPVAKTALVSVLLGCAHRRGVRQ